MRDGSVVFHAKIKREGLKAQRDQAIQEAHLWVAKPGLDSTGLFHQIKLYVHQVTLKKLTDVSVTPRQLRQGLGLDHQVARF